MIQKENRRGDRQMGHGNADHKVKFGTGLRLWLTWCWWCLCLHFGVCLRSEKLNLIGYDYGCARTFCVLLIFGLMTLVSIKYCFNLPIFNKNVFFRHMLHKQLLTSEFICCCSDTKFYGNIVYYCSLEHLNRFDNNILRAIWVLHRKWLPMRPHNRQIFLAKAVLKRGLTLWDWGAAWNRRYAATGANSQTMVAGGSCACCGSHVRTYGTRI